MGTGLAASGRLDPAARERTLAAIADYVVIAAQHDASLACIATSAMRRASDGAAFADAVTALCGVEPRVLSGDEEATYSFLGATREAAGAACVAVLDVGGGSTELAVDVPAEARARDRVAFTHSVEVGAVRLAERFPALLGGVALDAPARAGVLERARADVAAVLAPFAASPKPERAVVVGGTAFTAAAMIAGGPLRDGVRMTQQQRTDLLEALLERDLDARRELPFIRPQRADILPAGIVIVDEAARRLGIADLDVSVADLLDGFLASAEYDRVARPARRTGPSPSG